MVGPGFDIALKTSAGTKVKHLQAGTYRLVVTDRTGVDSHNFHLKGFGVDKATGVPFVGTRTWTVRFTRGRRYRFVCDPHAFVMKGSFRVD
jgi:plastocyanin